jgi:hypothetical protein
LEELFEQLRVDLKPEVQAIAKEPWLSMRQKQQRYLRHIKKYDAARLNLQKPPLESTDRAAARMQICQSIEEILEEGGSTRSLSLVPEPPPGVSTLGITVDGAIADPEFPDRPPGDDPERLAEWNQRIDECARRYAEQYEITEPIQRSHGVFENAMPPDSLDRLIFRIPLEQQWMRETRRNALVVEAEKLIRKYPVELPLELANAECRVRPTALVRSRRSNRSITMMADELPPEAPRKAETVTTAISPERQRGQRQRTLIDPMLRTLGWSFITWANATAEHNHGHAMAYTTIRRYMNGTTAHLQNDSDRILRVTLQKALREAATRSSDPRIAHLASQLDQSLP